MEKEDKEINKLIKKNINLKKDKLESIINDDIKSIERLKYFNNFIIEIIKEFTKRTEEYNNKLQALLIKLLPEELAKRKIINKDEIDFSKFLQDIIKLIINKINKMNEILIEYTFTYTKELEKNNKLENPLNNKKKEFLDNYLKQSIKVEKYNIQYYNEFSNLENNLTNKYSDSKNKIKEKNKNDNNNNDEKNIDDINNNIKNTKDIQDKLIKYIDDSNNIIQKNIKYFNDEKIFNQDKIYGYSTIFLDTILKGFFKEQDFIENINSLKKYIEDINNSKEKEINNLNNYKDFLFKIEPYSLKCVSNKENQNLDIIKKLNYKNIYSIITEIRNNDIQMSEEDIIKTDEIEKIMYIQKNIDLCFGKDFEEIKDDEKNQIFQQIKEYFKFGNIYRYQFILYLNNKRVNVNLKLNQKAFEFLGELLMNVNEYIMKEKNFKLFKIISLLSVTYYFMENDKKIYLCKYLNKCNEFNNKQFWIDYLKAILNDELKEDKILEKSLFDYSYIEIKNMKSKKLHTCIYSNLFSLSKIMKDFTLNKNFVIEWINYVADNVLYIDDKEKKDIIGIINVD